MVFIMVLLKANECLHEHNIDHDVHVIVYIVDS